MIAYSRNPEVFLCVLCAVSPPSVLYCFARFSQQDSDVIWPMGWRVVRFGQTLPAGILDNMIDQGQHKQDTVEPVEHAPMTGN